MTQNFTALESYSSHNIFALDQLLFSSYHNTSYWKCELYNGILHSRKKGGAPTLHNSMNGPGEHYAKWNKPGGERHIICS